MLDSNKSQTIIMMMQIHDLLKQIMATKEFYLHPTETVKNNTDIYH